MSRNQARDLEDWNPADGLDEFLIPLNMGVVGETEDLGIDERMFKPLIKRASEQLLNFDTRILTDGAKKCATLHEFNTRIADQYLKTADQSIARVIKPLAESAQHITDREPSDIVREMTDWMTEERRNMVSASSDISGVKLFDQHDIENKLTELLWGKS